MSDSGLGPQAGNDALRDLRSAAYFVDQRIALLRHYRAIYEKFREVILFNPEQQALRFGHFFITAFADWHRTAVITSLRALVEKGNRKTPQLSVYGVLERLINAGSLGVINVANVVAIKEAQADLLGDGLRLYNYASQRVVHHDARPTADDIETHEIDSILEHVDNALGVYWNQIFDGGASRLVVDTDPYWAELLFAIPWLPPTKFNERLALGSEARLVS